MQPQRANAKPSSSSVTSPANKLAWKNAPAGQKLLSPPRPSSSSRRNNPSGCPTDNAIGLETCPPRPHLPSSRKNKTRGFEYRDTTKGPYTGNRRRSGYRRHAKGTCFPFNLRVLRQFLRIHR